MPDRAHEWRHEQLILKTKTTSVHTGSRSVVIVVWPRPRVDLTPPSSLSTERQSLEPPKSPSPLSVEHRSQEPATSLSSLNAEHRKSYQHYERVPMTLTFFRFSGIARGGGHGGRGPPQSVFIPKNFTPILWPNTRKRLVRYWENTFSSS